MAGCGERSLWLLGRYGTAVGEAFQLRDDLLGIFGSASVTGKPSGGDLRDRKATSVVVAAHHLADSATRSELTALSQSDELDESDIERWRALISTTGAVDWIEDMITDRVAAAQELVYRLHIDESVQAGLGEHGGCLARCVPHDDAQSSKAKLITSSWSARAGRAVGGAAPGRSRPCGHRRRTRRRPRRPGRQGRCRRIPDRHGSDRADDARHHRRHLRRGRRVHSPTASTDPGRPGLPRHLRRWQPILDVHRDADAMADGHKGIRRASARGRGYLRLRAWLTRLYEVEFDGFIARQLRFPALAADPSAGPAGGDGRLPPVGPRGAAVHHRRTPAAHLHFPGALRRRATAERAGGVRGDRLHGYHRRSVLPARRHARTARRAGRGGRGRRCRIPLLARSRSWNAAAPGSPPCTPTGRAASPATRSC